MHGFVSDVRYLVTCTVQLSLEVSWPSSPSLTCSLSTTVECITWRRDPWSELAAQPAVALPRTWRGSRMERSCPMTLPISGSGPALMALQYRLYWLLTTLQLRMTACTTARPAMVWTQWTALLWASQVSWAFSKARSPSMWTLEVWCHTHQLPCNMYMQMCVWSDGWMYRPCTYNCQRVVAT